MHTPMHTCATPLLPTPTPMHTGAHPQIPPHTRTHPHPHTTMLTPHISTDALNLINHMKLHVNGKMADTWYMMREKRRNKSPLRLQRTKKECDSLVICLISKFKMCWQNDSKIGFSNHNWRWPTIPIVVSITLLSLKTTMIRLSGPLIHRRCYGIRHMFRHT